MTIRRLLPHLALAAVAAAVILPECASAGPIITATDANVVCHSSQKTSIDAIAAMFTYSTSGLANMGKLALYYERVCAAFVFSMLILRLVVSAARDGIDGMLTNAFNTLLGPSILFAVGVFLATSLVNSGSNWVVGKAMDNAINYGTSHLATGFNSPSAEVQTMSTDINLRPALDEGNIGSIITTGFGLAGSIFNQMPTCVTPAQVAAAQIVIQQKQDASKGGFQWPNWGDVIDQALASLMSIVAACFLLWVFCKLLFELYTVFLTKTILLPLGLIFFAMGQMQIVGNFKDAFIRLLLTTWIRIALLATFVPLFLGVILYASINFINSAL